MCESTGTVASWGDKFVLSASDLKNSMAIIVASKNLFNKDIIGSTDLALMQFASVRISTSPTISYM